MMRSPQKVSEDQGIHTYRCEIRNKMIQVQVSQKEYEKWGLKGKTGQELQELLEAILHKRHQQRQSDQAGGSGQHQQPSAMDTGAATYTNSSAAATAAMATTDSTPAGPPLPPRNESMTTPTAGAPQHSSTPMNATSRPSEVKSPISIDEDLEDIKDRTARMEEDLIQGYEDRTARMEKDLLKANEEKLIHKDTGARPKTTTPKLDQQNSEDNQETHLKMTECQDRKHEFEQRTKKYLAAPAKRFIHAYNTCKYHFEKNVHKWISEERAQHYLGALVDCFHAVDEARDYCLEALSEEDKLNNPKYEEYMDLKHDQLNECSRLQDQYLERWHRQHSQLLQESQKREDLQLLQETQKHEAKPQDQPFVPQPTGQAFHPIPSEGQPQLGHPQVYQAPSQNPIISRPHPVVTDNPPKQAFCPITSKGQPQPEIKTQVIQPEPWKPKSSKNFQVYEDPNPATQSMATPRMYEPAYPKLRMKDELEVIPPFDGTPEKYLRFRVQWENLEVKMNKAEMTEMDKFYNLIKACTGKARDLIDTKYPNSESYRKARHQLESTYYNPKLHMLTVFEAIVKVDKMEDTYESLFKGFNRLKDSWDDLDNMNLTKEQIKGLFLIASNERNLSESTWTLWNTFQNDPKYAENPMECFNVNAFLGVIQTAMKNALSRQNVVGSKPTTHQKPKPKPRSTLYGSYAASLPTPKKEVQKQAGSSCVFCDRRSHHQYQLFCSGLKKLRPEEIWKIMKKHGIDCSMCLCPGHDTRDCEATKKNILKRCSIKNPQGEICGKFHCKFLCRFLHRTVETERPTESKESKSTNHQ